MSFLKFAPIIFVIENKYEILLIANRNGLFSVRIGGESYYENHSGVRSSEASVAKIVVPQSLLNKCKQYDVEFKETIDRKSYYSEFGPLQRKTFAFKPLEKTENIHIYHFADIHCLFEEAEKAFSYYENQTDLLIVNGDSGEVNAEQDYIDICKNLANMSKGYLPVIFTRGNHDARGKLAERFHEYFPSKNRKFYYTFDIGCLSGVVLDLGEDKYDDNIEYGGVNLFEAYRKSETRFLQGLKRKNNRIFFAISHICPACTTPTKNELFDIEHRKYSIWNKKLDELNTAFMLTGHLHFYDILYAEDDRNTLSHHYPVIIGSAIEGKNRYLVGAYLTICGNMINVKFTNNHGKIECEKNIEL